MDHGRAARLIAGLFEDEGRELLTEAELPTTWERALQTVPPAALRLPDGPPERLPERLLARVRDVWTRQKRLRPSIAATKALVRIRVRRYGEEHPDTLVELGALGALADRAGRTDEARKLLEEAWQGLRSIGGGNDLRLAVVAANLGSHYLRHGEPHKALPVFEQAWRIREERAPGSGAMVAAQLGQLRLDLGELDEAETWLKRAWEVLRERPGPKVLPVGRNLVSVLLRRDRALAAEPVLRELYAAAKASGDGELIASAAFDLGLGLNRVGLPEEGYRFLEEAVRWTREAGDPHPKLPERLTAWAEIIIHQRKRPGEGEGILKEALEAERRMYGDDSPQVAVRYAAIGHLCSQLGRKDEAMGYLDPAARLLRSTRGDHHPHTRRAVEYFAELLVEKAMGALARRDRELAREYVRHVLEMGPPVLGYGHHTVRAARELERA